MGFLVYLNQKNFKNLLYAEKPILCLEMRGIIKKTIFDEYIAINMTLGKRTFYVRFQHVRCATLFGTSLALKAFFKPGTLNNIFLLFFDPKILNFFCLKKNNL